MKGDWAARSLLCLLTCLLAFVIVPEISKQSAFGAADTWSITYGGSESELLNSLELVSDGGYVVAGRTESFNTDGDENFWVVRLDSEGIITWEKTYDLTDFDQEPVAKPTSDGGFIVGGTVDAFSPEGTDLWVLKLDSNGDIEWENRYDLSASDGLLTVQQTSDGGYLVTAVADITPSDLDPDVWLLKLDLDGNIEWEKTYGGSGFEIARASLQTIDGGYLLGGEADSFGNWGWLVKLDSDGNIEWEKSFVEHTQILAVEQTSDEGYAITGYSQVESGTRLWVAKFDSNGNAEWEKVYTDSDSPDTSGSSIKQTFDGGYIVAGDRSGFTPDFFQDAWLLKLDTDGNIEWEKIFGGVEDDSFREVRVTPDGYLAAGQSSTFDSDTTDFHSDFWLVKLDSDGNLEDCATDFIQESSADLDEIETENGDTSASVADSASVITATSATVEETSATVANICELPVFFYSLDIPAADSVVDLNQEVTAFAGTTDPDIDNVIFRWIRPDGEVIREQSVPIGTGEDTFAPDREGDWTVEADFQNGQVVRRTLSVTFFVLPESPIGALAMAAASMGTLGVFIYYRMWRRQAY